MTLIARHLAGPLLESLFYSRIVNLVGPRQAGKTTLVRDLVKAHRFITLDDEAELRSLTLDPYGQLRALADEAKTTGLPIVIDEVQRAPPGIDLAVKRIVDVDNRSGQFLLTGSSDVFAQKRSRDSLAGRVSTFTLRPLSVAEIAGARPCLLLDAVAAATGDWIDGLPRPRSLSRPEAIDIMVRGGFPEIRTLLDAPRMRRYASYLDSIVERDVSPVAQVRKTDALRRMIDQMAFRTGQELNVASLCSALAVRKQTAAAHLDVLARLSVVHLLGAWAPSRAKREIRAPKLHLMDTGCATALRGEDSASFGLGADTDALGAVIETFVFIEIEKSLPFLSKVWRLHHWRVDRREIDLIAEAPGKLLALIETKASTDVGLHDFRHIRWFGSEGPGRSYRTFGFVIYLGEHVLSFGPGLLALPLSMLWS
ncbi:MAG: ATP-binding protein [Stellaceae bacterium]